MERQVNLSVIIPTRNRAEILKDCLTAIGQQTIGASKFEVIVVDNGSNDQTEDVVRSFSNSLQINYSYIIEPGLHIARHEGLRLAKTDLLVYTDDDTKSETMWLEAIDEIFCDPIVALAGGNNYPEFEKDTPDWLLRLWRRPIYKGFMLSALSIVDFGEGCFEIDPRYIWGCNFSIRKQVLIDAGGFHPDGFPEENLRFRGDGETYISDYVRSSKFNAIFHSKASVYHSVPQNRMSKEYFCRRYFAQGISDSYSVIRSLGGIPTYRHHIRLMARSLMNYVVNIAKRIIYMNDPVEIQLAKVQIASQRAYMKGFQFHQKEVSRDPDLLAWVLKETYL